MSAALAVLVCLPFVVLLGKVIADGDFSLRGSGVVNDGVDWGTYLTTTLWLWMGFDQIGSVAGEVQNVGRTLSVGVVIAAFSVSFVYAIPVVIGMCVMPDTSTWQAGSFVTLGVKVLGSGGGYMVAIAGMLSSVGIFEATLATTSRALWAMAGGCPEEIPVPMVPRALAYSRKVGECTVPVAAVVTEALVTAVLVNISFQVWLLFCARAGGGGGGGC